VTAYGQRSMMTSPGVQEFYEVIRALEARSQRQSSRHAPIFATAGWCLWQRDVSVAGARYACTVYALSPSDVSIRPLSWQVELFGDARPLDQVYVT
jgi:hypothetical protein